MRREETTQTTHMTTNTHTKHHKTRLKHGDAKHAPPPPAQTPTGITPHHHTTNWQGRQWFFVCTGLGVRGGVLFVPEWVFFGLCGLLAGFLACVGYSFVLGFLGVAVFAECL